MDQTSWKKHGLARDFHVGQVLSIGQDVRYEFTVLRPRSLTSFDSRSFPFAQRALGSFTAPVLFRVLVSLECATYTRQQRVGQERYLDSPMKSQRSQISGMESQVESDRLKAPCGGGGVEGEVSPPFGGVLGIQ